jgi:AcrR family transcriptional regulator
MDLVTTETKILAAAEQIFMKAGYDGARMQEIADLAGINKAMLHYYFRSKDALFERIFEKKFADFFPKVKELVSAPISFTEKVCLYVELHINLLRENPYLPIFILNTVHKNENFVQKMPTILIPALLSAYFEDLEAKKVRELNPVQFFMSVMSMCVFPFAGKPIFQQLGTISEEGYDDLMQQRIAEVQLYVRAILKPS